MNKLLPVNSISDILPEYRDTPVGRLLEYHNLDPVFKTYENAMLLVGTCMVNLIAREPEFMIGLIKNAGWKRDQALLIY